VTNGKIPVARGQAEKRNCWESLIMDDHDDFAFEPIPGLPALPPKGEEVLWQGRPDTLALAREAFGLVWVAVYFVGLVLWRGSVGWAEGGAAMAAAMGIPYALLGAAACGLLLLLAFAQARTTVYTVTTARVAMRIGAALSITLNLPFAKIGTGRLALRKNGTGTIVLETLGSTRISYLVCWPHVRPLHVLRTQPALRCIPDAARVARLMADAAEARFSLPVVSRTAPVPRAPATAIAAE